MHAAEAHADGHDDQADHQRREVGAGRDVELVRNRQHEQEQKSGADDLIEKSGLRPRGEGREGCEDACSSFQLGIDLVECRQIVSIGQSRGEECSGSLRDGIRHDFAPGKITKDREGEGDGGIEMAAGNFSRDVDSHRDGESPSQSDVGVAAMNGCRGIICGKQHDHGDDARAEENQDEGSEELGDQFGD